jgi:adenylyltransferase/sulfurtransferase
VVGCGALGNEVLKNLVLMGVTKIVAVDFDIVETGNLTRSILFRKEDAEKRRRKVDVVAERLKEINPDAEVKTICGDIAYDVGLGLVRKMDVIIGCVDSRWARFCINRLAMRAGRPWVDGGIEGLEGTARVFAPGKNCYACNLGPEGLKEMKRRMPCTGIIRRMEAAGSAPTTSIVASVIGAIQVQEALKIILALQATRGRAENGELRIENGEWTSLCGRMLYYEGGHMTVRTAEYQAYDDDCTEHELWTPVLKTQVDTTMTAGEALAHWQEELSCTDVTLCLRNDCYVDYVSRRDNDERTPVMLPGRQVEAYIEHDSNLRGLQTNALYQHEYREVGKDFPYPEQTLAQLGIPQEDIVHVKADGKDVYLELRE